MIGRLITAESKSPAGLRRWIPTVSMLLVSVISYVDRQTLALLSPTILRETHLSGAEYGFIISGFSFAYMLTNPVWGRILDRIGVRLGMTLAVAFWTLASAGHSLAAGFVSFAAARVALGLGEGATFPGGLRTVTQTLSLAERGRGVAVAYSGGSLGAIITPIIVTPIALEFGWRGAFLFTGLLGAGWLVWWWSVSRDIGRPQPLAHTEMPAPRWTDPRLWGFMSAYALGGLPIGFVLYETANFLSQAHGSTQAFIGMVLWIPPLGWEIGYFVWGWLCDRGTRSSAEPLVAIRRMMLAAALSNLPLAAVPHLSAMWPVMAELFLAMFLAAGFIILAVAYATRVFSTSHAGFIAGVGAGSWGAAVAIFMPLFGWAFDLHRYDVAFLIAALAPVLGYFVWRRLSSIEGS